ncbi:MAG: CBS domain-containing protein, partial [Calditrichales bacterium]
AHQPFDVTLADIVSSFGLAVFCAIFSILFIRTLRHTSNLLDQYFPNDLIKAVSGGLLVAIIAFLIPAVRGEGYSFVENLISGRIEQSLGLILLVVLFKIIATSLTLGAGGAGGVFAPSLVIGSAGGYLFYSLLKLIAPQLELSDSSLFALVGMSGLISGTLRAPLTGIFLIIEITSGYQAILPLLLVSFITPALMRLAEKHSIYHDELIKKGYLLRPRTDGRILADIQPLELLEQDQIIISPNLSLRELIPIIKKSNRNYFPVVDNTSSEFLGLVFFNDIKEFIFDDTLLDSILVEDVMHTDLTHLSLQDNLLDIQNKFDLSEAWSLPVVENGEFKGLISKATMLDLYRKELKVQTEK